MTGLRESILRRPARLAGDLLDRLADQVAGPSPLAAVIAEQKADAAAAHLAHQRREALPEEERQRIRAECDAAAAAVRELALAVHDALIARARGFEIDMLAMHGPVDHGGDLVCGGCEFHGYDAEPPEHPCRTYTAAALQQGVDLADLNATASVVITGDPPRNPGT